MANHNSKIILAKNIKLDREYNNVLSYSESDMLLLLRGLTNFVAEQNDYNFVRGTTNQLDVSLTYAQCLQSNYVAFQNPDYSNKWFFAFITSVEMVSPGTTRITFEIDEFSTWWDYWSQKPCFVVREHVTDDSIGANTIPENIEMGDFIINAMSPIAYQDMNLNTMIVIGLSKGLSTLHDNNNRIYNGLYSGLYYVAFGHAYNASENATKFIRGMTEENASGNIVSIFVLPQKLVAHTTAYQIQLGSQTLWLYDVDDTTTPVAIDTQTITLNSTLNGYTPRNNKLRCYPFNYILMSNNAGSTAVYKYEDFIDNSPSFKVVGCFSQGGSVKLIPQNYKKYSSTSYNNASAIYGLNGGKYPTCGWITDSYIAWLSQNGANLATGLGGGALQTIAGAGLLMASPFTGGATTMMGIGLIGSGGVSILETMAQMHQAEMQPNQAHGNTNCGDLSYTGHMMSFDYFQMSIRAEYARSIDDFFDRKGYKVNRIKIPNQETRPYWNFVQIGKEESCGYSNNANVSVPTNSMLLINNIYRRGVTIWHSHENLGNYSLNNH